jgi:hypothetical protein
MTSMKKGKTNNDGSFRYFAPISFFEKSDAEEGQRRRFAGIASTDTPDQEDEVVLQNGLEWNHFVTKGWFNDNHSRKTGGVVGYPTGVKFFAEGTRLPDGSVAKSNLHWTEGYLLEGVPAADDIWNVGQALKKAGAGRQLGQSIEGKILKRAGDKGEVIAQAKITNVAITHCPVNADTNLGFLAKSLIETAVQPAGYTYQTDLPDAPEVHMDYKDWDAAEEQALEGQEEEEKTLTTESGAALIPESLEDEEHNTTYKALHKAAAVSLVLKRLPNISCATAGRVVDLALQMKLKGLI